MPSGHMGTPIGAPISNNISLGSTSLNYCPFGAGMYAWMYAWSMHGGGHIRSVPLREFSFLRAPSGPLIPFGDMGTLWAPMWAPPMGHPLFKNKNVSSSGHFEEGFNQ